MNEDAIKYLALAGGGVLFLFLVMGGRRGGKAGPDVEATLESMRISSQTNIAYAQAGVENARIMAGLTAEKDKNRSTIRVAGIENETVRYGIKRNADTEVAAIDAGRAMFAEQLRHELGMSYREQVMRRMEFQHERRLDGSRGAREVVLEKLRAKSVADAARFGVQVEIGRQGLQEKLLENSFIQGLLQRVPSLTDAFGRGLRDVSHAFGWGSPQSVAPGAATYSTVARGNTGYPAGVIAYSQPGFNDPLPQFADISTGDRAIGAGVGALGGAATGAMAGSVIPGVGTAIGAGVGAVAGAAGGGGGGLS